MRKTLAVVSVTGALLFGGAGIANAVPSDVVPTSTTTTLAQEQQQTEKSDKTGLWGLAGLLGLAGLAGLMRRKETHSGARPTGPGGTTPRA